MQTQKPAAILQTNAANCGRFFCLPGQPAGAIVTDPQTAQAITRRAIDNLQKFAFHRPAETHFGQELPAIWAAIEDPKFRDLLAEKINQIEGGQWPT